MNRNESYLADSWEVFMQIGDTHIPTLLMGRAAIVIRWGLSSRSA